VSTVTTLTTALRPRRAGFDRSRRQLRTWGAALCGAIALIYAAIALHLVSIVDGPAAEVARTQWAFAAPAAVVFLLGAFLLLRYDDRRLWAVGAVLQVLVFAMYLAVAPERQPAYELWGVTLRLLQLGLLVPLVLLAVRRPVRLAERDR
jgi:hypothetical protein